MRELSLKTPRCVEQGYRTLPGIERRFPLAGARGTDRVDLGQRFLMRFAPTATRLHHPLFMKQTRTATEGMLVRMQDEFLANTLAGLDASPHLQPAGREELRAAIIRAQRYEIPASDVVNIWWRHMGLDAARTEFEGASVKVIDYPESGDPTGNIVTVTMPIRTFTDYKFRRHVPLDHHLSELMGHSLGIKLVHADAAQKTVTLEFPSPGVCLEMMGRRFHRYAARMACVDGFYDPRLANALHFLGIHALGFPLQRKFYGENDPEQHPFIFAFHDLFHYFNFSTLHPYIRMRAAMLGEALNQLCLQGNPFPLDRETILMRLVDLDDMKSRSQVDLANLVVFPICLALLEQLDKLHLAAERQVYLRQCKDFLDRYLELVGSTLPDVGGRGKDKIYRELVTLQDIMQKMLKAPPDSI